MSARTNRIITTLIAVFVLVTTAPTFAGQIIYVDADSPANFNNIQAAINNSNDDDVIIVADGTYKGYGNRDIDFLGKAITLRSENGPENCIIDCEGSDMEFHRGFYFHSGEDRDSVLDGFTIINGFSVSGGGIFCEGSSPTISNNIIRNNITAYDYEGGGGISCRSGASPLIMNNIITENASADLSGGGIYCYEAGSPIIANNMITGNYALYGGGIGCAWSVSPLIMNNIIVGNTGGYSSGGIYCWGGFSAIMNNIIAGNTAKYGGGIYCSSSSPTITNNTIVGNMANAEGGGIWCWKGSSPTVTNCIFWGNAARNGPQVALRSNLYYGPSALTVNYSDLAGGQAHVYIEEGCTLNWGEGNIDADPCFVEQGYWDTNDTPDDIWDDSWFDGDYHLLPTSPCIDAGDPNYIAEPNETDLDGKPRVLNGNNDGITVIDMGAYEHRYTIFAEARIVPRTINLASKGKWISCYIWLPEDCDVADIDPNSVLLEDKIEAESVQIDEGKQVVTARFSREQVQAILCIGQVELSITGLLTDEATFHATDAIRVIDKASKKASK